MSPFLNIATAGRYVDATPDHYFYDSPIKPILYGALCITSNQSSSHEENPVDYPGAALYEACSTNAVTGRKQLTLFLNQHFNRRPCLNTNLLGQNSALHPHNKDAEMVKRVGNRIANAITSYYSGKGLTKNWKVTNGNSTWWITKK